MIVYHTVVYKPICLPPLPANRTLGPLAAFLRPFPPFVGLYRRFHLFQANGPLDPLIAGNDLPQGLGLLETSCLLKKPAKHCATMLCRFYWLIPTRFTGLRLLLYVVSQEQLTAFALGAGLFSAQRPSLKAGWADFPGVLRTCRNTPHSGNTNALASCSPCAAPRSYGWLSQERSCRTFSNSRKKQSAALENT